ncbi:MAG: asparagine synthase-related protein, partial [Acidobacteria bacterium]|nr:asparagine synthase-related protein [Acidobacteriota bacterium]
GDLDEAAVATWLTFGSRPLGDRTCYRAVRRLRPGHALSVERDAARVPRRGRPGEGAGPTGGPRGRGARLGGARARRGAPVPPPGERQRRARPPPLAFSRHPPPAPGWGGGASPSEYARIEAVRRQESLKIFYRPREARDLIAFLRRDGTRPAAGGRAREEAVRCAPAGQGVEVLLSGLGGDEGISFNGRGYYPELLRSGRAGKLWRELQQRSRSPLTALVADAVLPLVSPGAKAALRRLRRGKWPFRQNVTLIHPEFAGRVRLLRAAPARPAGVRRVQLWLLERGHLSERMEVWAASGECRGIEYRHPLLDRRVLEFALALPPEQFRRGRWSRWLMRRALDPVLPPEVCWNTDKAEPALLEQTRDAVA